MNPEQITYFAQTDARNKREKFGIKAADRTKHMYVIGKTGMGKSTMLENMVIQDIRNGEGLAFIDPHGSSAEKILDYVPEERINDVVYFAPFDMDYPIAFNVMEDVGYDKRHLVSSGLMSAFRKIWADQWSSRMEYILTNTLLALLEFPDSTMLGINKMYADKAYRKKVIEYVKDPLVKSFWEDEFAKFTDSYSREATPAIQNKVGQFTGNPLIRNIIGQPKSSFDLRDIIDNQKILICNLSKGLVGETNANLLGSMLITKIYLAAMGRADVSEAERQKLPNFYFYVDEFQSFANESFADILSEARKYKLNLTMAHQYIEQMSEEVRAAVFGNIGTMITFRVGAFDAEVLAKEFMPTFTEEDLVNLGFTQIYLKLMIDGVSSTPFSATTILPDDPPAQSNRDKVIDASRKTFGSVRQEVEEAIAKIHAPPAKPEPKPREGAVRSSAQGARTTTPGAHTAEKRDAVSAAPHPGQGSVTSVEKTTPRKDIQQKNPRPALEVSNHKDQLSAIAAAMKEGAANITKKESVEPLHIGKLQRDESRKLQKPQNFPVNKSKEPSKEHKESLRSALADVIGTQKQNEQKPNEGHSKQDSPQESNAQPQKPEQQTASQPKEPPESNGDTKEVPEDVLKKILEVEE